jgi:hypothetical protein
MFVPRFLAGYRKTKRILMLRNNGQLRQGRSYNVVISTAEQLIAMKQATEEKKKSVEPAVAALPVPSQNKIVTPASLQTSTPAKPAGPVTPKSRKQNAKPLHQSGR